MRRPNWDLFARFQNLNLLILIQDLRHGLIARGNWLAHDRLCPVAHGMADGDAVEHLEYLNHARNLDAACDFAARELGLSSTAVSDFVQRWDESYAADWLLAELEQIWAERREDADAVQGVLRLDAASVFGANGLDSTHSMQNLVC